MYLFKNELMDIQSWNKKGKIFKHHQASLRFIREGKGETLVLIPRISNFLLGLCMDFS